MPSKTLIYAAEILHHARSGSTFGLDIPEAKPDMARLQQRKREIIADFADYRVQQLTQNKFHLVREHARFLDERTIELSQTGQRLTASRFIIATGSVQQWPDIPGLDSPGIWTSDEVLDLDYLPESVIVLGGGVIACELAQYLRRLGSKVTMIQRSNRILREASDDAAAVIEHAFADESLRVYTGTTLKSIEKTSVGFRVNFDYLDKPLTAEAAHVFNALGRRPNTASLNLDAAGVKTSRNGGIIVNQQQQSSNPHIYAVGDCCGPIEIVHLAIMQGEVAAQHAAGKNPPPVDYEKLVQVVFTDPQVASAGLTEDIIKARGIDYAVATYPFDDHGKSILMEAKYGYVRVFAQKSDGLILGAECVGKDAGELIHSMAVAVALNAKCGDLLKAHWYHPTLSEIWTYPLEDLEVECR